MSEYSFDVTAQVDLVEVSNAHQMALRQIATRYDFKGKVAQLSVKKEEKQVIAEGTDDYIVGQMMEIFSTHLAKRGVDLKALEEKSVEQSPSGAIRKTFVLRDSMKSEETKEITKAIKNSKLKLRAVIQGDSVRIIGKSKDDLQAAQALIRGLNLEVPIRFTNYK